MSNPAFGSPAILTLSNEFPGYDYTKVIYWQKKFHKQLFDLSRLSESKLKYEQLM